MNGKNACGIFRTLQTGFWNDGVLWSVGCDLQVVGKKKSDRCRHCTHVSEGWCSIVDDCCDWWLLTWKLIYCLFKGNGSILGQAQGQNSLNSHSNGMDQGILMLECIQQCVSLSRGPCSILYCFDQFFVCLLVQRKHDPMWWSLCQLRN